MKTLACIVGFVSVVAMGAGACGGGVTVEGQGGAGSTGSQNTGSQNTGSQSTGSQSTGSQSTSSNMSTSIVGTSTGSSGLCSDVCSKAMQLGCDTGPDCVGECEDFFATVGECSDELGALYSCFLANAMTCETGPECGAEQAAFQECFSSGGCGPTECGGSGSGGMSECFCSQECDTATFGVACKTGPNGSQCACSINGMTVGECAEPNGSSCAIFEGCCSMFFSQEG